jgi:deoxyribose-phosphate aldolase
MSATRGGSKGKGAEAEPSWSLEDIAGMIDHSLLNPALTQEALEAGIKIALEHKVASVCILPYYLRRCAELLKGSGVRASTTIGFPHGGQVTAVKVAEAGRAIDHGGEELDAVVNISRVLSADWDYIRTELKGIIELSHSRGAKVKVIFENCYLRDEHKVMLCEICGELRADWVKTSTGFGPSGATIPDLELMRKHSPAWVQVKAAGGVRDLDTVLAVRAIGVTRFGCTRTVEVLAEAKRRLDGARRGK